MNTSYIIYSLAVAWFTYHVFWMAMRIYQFKAFPKTYGTQALLSLQDLGESACDQGRDIPSFKVIVPAFMETDVIEGTLYRLSSMNYPQTHFEIHVVTYEDEPISEGKETTTDVVKRVAAEINKQSGVDLVNSIVTPAKFDGFFPGDLEADEQHIGKARGLNYALRRIHEENEKDERSYYIGRMIRDRNYSRIVKILKVLNNGFSSLEEQSEFIKQYFTENERDYIGPLTHTSQLASLVNILHEMSSLKRANSYSWETLVKYIEQEASRFYLQLEKNNRASSELPELSLVVIEDKHFLYVVMRAVETQKLTDLESYSLKRDAELEQLRPILHRKLCDAKNAHSIYQLTRKINSRWVMVYDADADAPLDVMRHLAGRILAEPEVMGFQGPVAPLLNYDSVHSLCRMGALWMAFWHGAAYPRLLHNKAWAHPLAGTNWCFRIEGFEYNKRLIRDCDYNEKKRKILLTFDPRQLTEDLETGIRNFSEWSVNAAWHPIVEMEQVPPTPGAMYRQHTRWSLGTLQTMSYIFRSRLPFIQKAWYGMYPLRVLFASSGPFITGGLIIAFYMDLLNVEPVFAWWTLFLAFGNFIYIWAFITTFQRYFDTYQQASAVNFIYKNRAELLQLIGSESHPLTKDYAQKVMESINTIKNGMRPGGFVNNYLQSRYADDLEGEYASDKSKTYISQLKQATPESISREKFTAFISGLEDKIGSLRADAGSLQDVSYTNQRHPKLDKMLLLTHNATHKAGINRKLRWSRYHTQILIWAIPFVYFSVTPFFKAFWLWAKGDKTPWHKTTRTVKKQVINTK